MKRHLFFVALATVALASCSQDETVEVNNGQAIGFRTAMGTRAVETTVGSLDYIYVTALNASGDNYFKDAKFERGQIDGTNSSAPYTSAPVYYWPASGTLDFHAYAPAGMDDYVDFNRSATGSTRTVTNFEPAAKFKDQVDFIYASALNQEKSDAGIALTFAHKLAQVEVLASNSNTGYVYKVKGVCLGQIGSKGSMDDLSGTAWTLSKTDNAVDKTTYSATYGTERQLGSTYETLMEYQTETESSTKVAETAMLIPQALTKWNVTEATNTSKGSFIGVLINAVTKDGAQVFPPTKNAYAWVAVPIEENWAAGNKYTYKLDFSKGIGNVAPEQPGVDDEDDDEIEVDENPGTGGDEILDDADISFTVTVTPITKTNNYDIDMKDGKKTGSN